MSVVPSSALVLAGPPAERGRAQARARPRASEAVAAISSQRLAERAAALALPAVRDYLERQADFARRHCEPEMAELEGIAQGFGLRWEDLFAGLHAAAVSDIARSSEGCAAWAAPWPAGGAVLAKNRDVRADTAPLQEVMLHEDARHPMRTVLCVGSLGAPGAYSSGINPRGLAVVDTAIRSTAYEVGWLRYFAMTRLLWSCETVTEALDFLGSVPHAGGGSVVLGDRLGHVAAVEFARGKPAIEQGSPVMRTNHFVVAPRGANAADAQRAENSGARFEALRTAFSRDGIPTSLPSIVALMGSHGDAADQALCRHGEGNRIRTISTSIYLTAPCELHFAPDNPCRAEWRRYVLDS